MKLVPLFLALAAVVMPKSTELSPTTQAAEDFLATLTPGQRLAAVYGLDSAERTNWQYVPAKRKGISWGEMNQVQQAAAKKLLESALSSDGYAKVEAIRHLEPVLAEMENGNKERDLTRYWFVFFGEPSESRPWVWRYEGHHLSLTFGNNKGKMISSTPQFLGSNPAEVRIGDQKGERVLAVEQDLGFKLVESFSAEQLEKAVVSKEAPSDILTTNARKAVIDGHLGVGYDSMDKASKKLLMELISVHMGVQTKGEQKRRMDILRKEGLGEIAFAWIGPVSRAGRHYYRIQGKSFLIEYDNTQTDGNHIHTVWRDAVTDFGGELVGSELVGSELVGSNRFGEDVLAEHYMNDHHLKNHR